MLTLTFPDAVVEAMKTFFRPVLFGSLMALCANSYALTESEAEDMADLTAVFVFLKMTVVTKIYPTARFAVRWSFCPAKSVGPE